MTPPRDAGGGRADCDGLLPYSKMSVRLLLDVYLLSVQGNERLPVTVGIQYDNCSMSFICLAFKEMSAYQQ